MAQEDIKPEIDQALTDLGFDLLEQNIDQDAAEAVRQDAEEASLIKWEIGQTKPCRTRVQGAPASFGYLCPLAFPLCRSLRPMSNVGKMRQQYTRAATFDSMLRAVQFITYVASTLCFDMGL